MVNVCNKAIKVCRYSRVCMHIRRYLRVYGLLVLRYLRVNGSSNRRLRGYLKVNWPLCQRALQMTCSCLPWFMVPSDCTYLHVIVYLKLFVPVWQDTWFYIDLTSESTIDCVNLHVRGKLRLHPCWLRYKILNTINVKGYLRLYVLHVLSQKTRKYSKCLREYPSLHGHACQWGPQIRKKKYSSM